MSDPKKEGEITPLPPITHPTVDLDEAPGACGSGIPPADFNPDPDEEDDFDPKADRFADGTGIFDYPEGGQTIFGDRCPQRS